MQRRACRRLADRQRSASTSPAAAKAADAQFLEQLVRRLLPPSAQQPPMQPTSPPFSLPPRPFAKYPYTGIYRTPQDCATNSAPTPNVSTAPVYKYLAPGRQFGQVRSHPPAPRTAARPHLALLVHPSRHCAPAGPSPRTLSPPGSLRPCGATECRFLCP